MGKPNIPDLQTLIQAGFDPKTRLPRKIGTKPCIKEDVKKMLREEVRKLEEHGVRDWSTIKSRLKDSLRDYIFAKTKRNPMILPIIMEV